MERKLIFRSETFFPLDSSDINGFIHKFPKWGTRCEATEPNYDVYKCENAINPTETTHYCSKWELSNAYYDVIFPKPIYITNYTIMGSDVNNDWSNMKKWNLYGVDDGNLIPLHHVEESGLTTSKKTITYTVQYSGYFSRFRITDVTPYSYTGGSETLRLGKIDFFWLNHYSTIHNMFQYL